MGAFYATFDILSTISDHRMNRFMMVTPLQPFIVIVLYLSFIYKIGPQLMRKREAFDLRKTIIAYNMSQIIINVLIFRMALKLVPHLSLTCSPSVDPLSDNPISATMLNGHYYYTLLKFYDLLETIFYVLRKKKCQISYLHVHHHIGILVAAWISCKYFPGGPAIYVGFYNTFVHAIMYCYYLSTSWDSKYRRKIWWKKYVTLLQIIQQCLILSSVFPTVVNVNCSYPKGWMALFSLNVLLVLYLFTRFYKKNYCSSDKIYVKKE